MDELRKDLQAIFRDVFEDDGIVLSDSMTAQDIDGWDSLMFINLIIAVEKRFKVRFSTAEVSGLKEPDQNVGGFLRLLAKKIGGAGS